MTVEKRTGSQGEIAIVTGLSNIIEDAGDFLDVMASAASDTLVLQDKHFSPAFFDLKSGILGEVLQKVSNYRRQLVIVGDWSNVESKSMRDFIRESNRGGQVVFVEDIDSGVAALR